MNTVVHRVAVAGVAVLAPAAVQAQTAGWSKLDGSRQSVVYVQDDAGVETKGRLLRIDPGSLVIEVDGAERQYEAARVRRVQKRDSFRNGAIIGAVFGAAWGLIGARIADCPGDDPGGDCPGGRAALFAFGIGTCTGIGIGIDALIPGRTTLYQAPSVGWIAPPGFRLTRNPGRLQLAPASPSRAVPPRAAIGMTFGW
jgi:hypothetical protein